ncbi:MAG: undecaprenyl-phosphate glucose phosphotransferase [Pseudomonadota bacterium]
MPKRGIISRYPSLLEIFYRFSDLVIIALTMVLVYAFYPRGIVTIYWVVVFIGLLGFSVATETTTLYRSWRGAGIQRQSSAIVQAWLFAVLGVLTFAFATKTSEDVSRVVVTLWLILTPVMMIIWRRGLQYFFILMRLKGRNTRRVAIAGAGELGLRVAKTIHDEPSMGLVIKGFYDDALQSGYQPLEDIACTVKGNLDCLIEDVEKGKFDLVYIVLPMRAQARMTNVVDALSDFPVRVYVVPDLFFFDMLNARWSDVGGIPAVSVLDTPYWGVSGIVKRVEDLIVAVIALVVAGVPMLVITVGIKLTSPGPVIFKQRRYGIDGKPIYIYKFRTMTCCEDGEQQFKQATNGDNRVTRFGAFLRRTSLDEFPQFINVLQGRMSVVGPRPHPVALDEQHRKRIRRYMSRNRVKPGITGYAQVSGWRGETDTLEKMEKRIEHDLEYIRNWSLWMDIKIIILTIFKVLRRDNAY